MVKLLPQRAGLRLAGFFGSKLMAIHYFNGSFVSKVDINVSFERKSITYRIF